MKLGNARYKRYNRDNEDVKWKKKKKRQERDWEETGGRKNEKEKTPKMKDSLKDSKLSQVFYFLFITLIVWFLLHIRYSLQFYLKSMFLIIFICLIKASP